MVGMDYVIEQLAALCGTVSPTGMSKAGSDYVQNELERMGYDAWRTRKGNVLACLGGEGCPILLCAHVDTLGAMVTALKPNGRLKFSHVGGYAENAIETENVQIHTRTGKTYDGTVQCIHASRHVFSGKGEIDRNEDTMEIVIDEIVHNADDVRKLGIMNGDFISLDPRTTVTSSGFVKSRHLDDKASAALLLNLAREAKDGTFKPARKTYIMFTTYEEVGHGASAGLPDDVQDLLAVDMGCVGGDLEGDETKVSICPKDGGGPYDYAMTTRLIELAKANELNFAVDFFPYYGSDAATALRSGRDIRHALIGPGVFASHGYERTHKLGLKNTYKLITAYLSEEAE